MKTTKDQLSRSFPHPGDSEDEELTPAPHPVAIRFEHLAEAETHLRIEESSNLFGPSNFIALSDDGTTVLSAHGKGAVFGKKREIRDGSGLPIFELHASSSSLRGAWYERDGQSSTQHDPSPTDVVLEIKGQDMERILFDVFYLGAKVARIRRLVPSVISSTKIGGKPLWEASVSANVDLSIVTMSVIALADILLQRNISYGALAGSGGLAG
ncbi:hypothetical protein MBLNU13_g07434t1 [Cladosporium sp. NU13]